MSDGKLTLYLDLEEKEEIFDRLKKRADLLNRAINRYREDEKSYKSIIEQLDKVTLELGILFANADKGPWKPYSQDCQREKVMRRLKKGTVHAICDFIELFAPKSSKQEQAALLNEVIKNFECVANGMSGHECFFVNSPARGWYGLETKIAYRIKLDATRKCICVDPIDDFEDIDA